MITSRRRAVCSAPAGPRYVAPGATALFRWREMVFGGSVSREVGSGLGVTNVSNSSFGERDIPCGDPSASRLVWRNRSSGNRRPRRRRDWNQCSGRDGRPFIYEQRSYSGGVVAEWKAHRPRGRRRSGYSSAIAINSRGYTVGWAETQPVNRQSGAEAVESAPDGALPRSRTQGEQDTASQKGSTRLATSWAIQGRAQGVEEASKLHKLAQIPPAALKP
jgi:hypothetical protein